MNPQDAVEGMVQVCQLLQVLWRDANSLWMLPVYPCDGNASKRSITLFQLEVTSCSEFLQGDVLFTWNLHLTEIETKFEVPAVVVVALKSLRESTSEFTFITVKCVIRNLFQHASQRSDIMSSIVKVSRLTSLLASPSILPPVTLLQINQLNSLYSGVFIVNAYLHATTDSQREESSKHKRHRGESSICSQELFMVELSDGISTITAYVGEDTVFLCSRLSLQSVAGIASTSLEEYTVLLKSYYSTDVEGRVFKIEAVSDVSVRAQANAAIKSLSSHSF